MLIPIELQTYYFVMHSKVVIMSKINITFISLKIDK